MNHAGVIYVAEGPDYTELACQSLRSLRQLHPDLPAHLFTDQPAPSASFDAIHPIPTGCNRAKIAGMIASPFERTLFLDCDTLVVGPVCEGFTFLDRFDLAIAHDVRRSSALIEEAENAPADFPQHNSGVMFFNKSPAMTRFLRDWAAAYDAAAHARDQVTLKDLLWESDLRFWVLPPEWNLRRVTMLDAWEPLDAIPRIIHSHQLLRHLRNDDMQVHDLPAILELEREALQAEWEALRQRLDVAELGDPVTRFRRARNLRWE